MRSIGIGIIILIGVGLQGDICANILLLDYSWRTLEVVLKSMGISVGKIMSVALVPRARATPLPLDYS